MPFTHHLAFATPCCTSSPHPPPPTHSPCTQDPTPGAASCSATASGELTQPLARNTLLLTKYVPPRPTPSDILYPGDVLRYGQKVRLLANPMAQVGGKQHHGAGGMRSPYVSRQLPPDSNAGQPYGTGG